MFQSIRYSQLALRIGLAAVFVWFGVDKLMHPQYWLDAWMPQHVQAFVIRLSVTPRDALNLLGIAEVLIALSLVTGFFIRWFAACAIVFLLAVSVTHGFSEVLIRDVGLIGALVALILWPERAYS
jgi:uncharacterized membrane protein YphA (DoxX/SURF4 family)